MKIIKEQLRKIIKEELETASLAPSLREAMQLYLGSLRATQLWLHAAHNLTKGTGFAGDHVNLYGEIYLQLQEDFDVAVEKAIGLTQDETVGCPIEITQDALDILMEIPSPSNSSAIEIAADALLLIKNHIRLLSEIFNSLELTNSLPLGLNDFLAASANQYDTYVYLLSQRVKE
jgi:hypothetical protein|tara:strand:+ start:1311 stop:1835 length:525 start_codon:yes stop_codon:yes gene_type:complete